MKDVNKKVREENSSAVVTNPGDQMVNFPYQQVHKMNEQLTLFMVFFYFLNESIALLLIVEYSASFFQIC